MNNDTKRLDRFHLVRANGRSFGAQIGSDRIGENRDRTVAELRFQVHEFYRRWSCLQRCANHVWMSLCDRRDEAGETSGKTSAVQSYSCDAVCPVVLALSLLLLLPTFHKT